MEKIIKKFDGGFIITRDHLEGKKTDKKIVDGLKKEGYIKFFQLFDDDDILYYSGYAHGLIDEFVPLNWAMYDSGCTSIKYRNPITKKMEIL